MRRLSDRFAMIPGVIRLPNPWTTPILSITDAASLLGMSRATLYRRVAAGRLTTYGGKVPTAALYRYLDLPIPERPVVPRVY